MDNTRALVLQEVRRRRHRRRRLLQGLILDRLLAQMLAPSLHYLRLSFPPFLSLVPSRVSASLYCPRFSLSHLQALNSEFWGSSPAYSLHGAHGRPPVDLAVAANYGNPHSLRLPFRLPPPTSRRLFPPPSLFPLLTPHRLPAQRPAEQRHLSLVHLVRLYN